MLSILVYTRFPSFLSVPPSAPFPAAARACATCSLFLKLYSTVSPVFLQPIDTFNFFCTFAKALESKTPLYLEYHQQASLYLQPPSGAPCAEAFSSLYSPC